MCVNEPITDHEIQVPEDRPIDGVGGQIPFSVHHVNESGCGVALEADEKIREKLRALLASRAPASAA
jgi:hypothetical protein